MSEMYNEDVLVRYGILADFISLIETNQIPFKNDLAGPSGIWICSENLFLENFFVPSGTNG